jgi:hypothetical protein
MKERNVKEEKETKCYSKPNSIQLADLSAHPTPLAYGSWKSKGSLSLTTSEWQPLTKAKIIGGLSLGDQRQGRNV